MRMEDEGVVEEGGCLALATGWCGGKKGKGADCGSMAGEVTGIRMVGDLWGTGCSHAPGWLWRAHTCDWQSTKVL